MVEIERLRAAFADLPDAGGEHLSETTWEQLACGELGAGAARSAREHILGCPECTAVAHAVLTLRLEAPQFDPDAPRSVDRPSAPRVTWLHRAALPALLTAAAAVLIVVVVAPGHAPGPGTAVQPAAGPVLRAARSDRTPLPQRPVGRVMRPPERFEWQPVDGAAGYVVDLLDGTGERLWSSPETGATSLGWPDAIGPVPGRYYWRVTAYRDAGGPPLASQLAAFDLVVSASPH